MTEKIFLQMIQDMIQDKVKGAPLERTVGDVSVRLNQDSGLYGITVYGPRGYDRVRDVRPERVDVVARKLFVNAVAG